MKKVFLKISQNSQTTVPESLFLRKFINLINFINKEALAQVFSCEIFKSTSFTKHFQVTVSDLSNPLLLKCYSKRNLFTLY